jgi:hypothetical protein
MNLLLSKKLNHELEIKAEILGSDKLEVIERALRFYFNALDNNVSLQKQFTEWDSLSDEALNNFDIVIK